MSVCHQRILRDEVMQREGCALNGHLLRDCTVEAITRMQAKDIIIRYEYLQSMPKVGRAYYGLKRKDGKLIGAVCFGIGGAPQARDFLRCGSVAPVICLERGACAPISAHGEHADNAASYLISRACKQARKDHGWGAFFAYSDVSAGELGTVYQACNWLYLGQGHRRGYGRSEFISPDGERFTSRRIRAMLRREGFNGTIKEWFPQSGFKRKNTPDKHKYVLILDKRLKLDTARFPPKPYPKRDDALIESVGAMRDWRTYRWPGYGS